MQKKDINMSDLIPVLPSMLLSGHVYSRIQFI